MNTPRFILLLLFVPLCFGFAHCHSEPDCAPADGQCNPFVVDLLNRVPGGDPVLKHIYYGVGSSEIWRRTPGGQLTQIQSGLPGLAQIDVHEDVGYIFYAIDTANGVQRSNLDGSGVITIENTVNTTPGTIYNPDRDLVFYTVPASNEIRQNASSGGSPSVFASATASLLYYDAHRKKIFGGDISGMAIGVVDSDTAAFLASYNLTDSPSAIAVDLPPVPYLYYSTGAGGTIRRLNLDDGGVITLVAGLTFAAGLGLDPYTRNLYFADRNGQTLNVYNLNSGEITLLDSGSQFSSVDLTFE